MRGSVNILERSADSHASAIASDGCLLIGRLGVVAGATCFLLGQALKAALVLPAASVHFFYSLGWTFLVVGAVGAAAELLRPRMQKSASAWFVEEDRRSGALMAGAVVTGLAGAVMLFAGKATGRVWPAVLFVAPWLLCSLRAMMAAGQMVVGPGRFQAGPQRTFTTWGEPSARRPPEAFVAAGPTSSVERTAAHRSGENTTANPPADKPARRFQNGRGSRILKNSVGPSSAMVVSDLAVAFLTLALVAVFGRVRRNSRTSTRHTDA